MRQKEWHLTLPRLQLAVHAGVLCRYRSAPCSTASLVHLAETLTGGCEFSCLPTWYTSSRARNNAKRRRFPILSNHLTCPTELIDNELSEQEECSWCERWFGEKSSHSPSATGCRTLAYRGLEFSPRSNA